MDKVVEFFKTILDLLIAFFWLIYIFVTFIFDKIGSFFGNIYFPVILTKTRIFQEKWLTGTLLLLFVLFFLIMNISAFNLFRKDKIMSKKNLPMTEDEYCQYERISEKKLLSRCFFGGAVGGFLGMKICHHKTAKPKFNIGVTAMLIIQLLLFSFVIGYLTFWFCLA